MLAAALSVAALSPGAGGASAHLMHPRSTQRVASSENHTRAAQPHKNIKKVAGDPWTMLPPPNEDGWPFDQW
jgi:hypothetical protein